MDKSPKPVPAQGMSPQDREQFFAKIRKDQDEAAYKRLLNAVTANPETEKRVREDLEKRKKKK